MTILSASKSPTYLGTSLHLTNRQSSNIRSSPIRAKTYHDDFSFCESQALTVKVSNVVSSLWWVQSVISLELIFFTTRLISLRNFPLCWPFHAYIHLPCNFSLFCSPLQLCFDIYFISNMSNSNSQPTIASGMHTVYASINFGFVVSHFLSFMYSLFIPQRHRCRT
jgi:hypothetical protein